jgi:hypothetical protein
MLMKMIMISILKITMKVMNTPQALEFFQFKLLY